FCLYIEWPDNAFPAPDSSLVLGVMASPEFADELTRVVAGRTIRGRPIEVRRVRGAMDSDIAGLQLLFVPRSEQPRLVQRAPALRSKPLLIVTEAPSGLDDG